MEPAGFCPRCDYPIDPGVCSECGTEVSERRLRRKPRGYLRRNTRRVTVILAFALIAGVIVGTRTQLVPRFPTGYLLILAQGDGQLALAAATELARRWRLGRLSDPEKSRIATALAEVSWSQRGPTDAIVANDHQDWLVGVPITYNLIWIPIAKKAGMPPVLLAPVQVEAKLDGVPIESIGSLFQPVRSHIFRAQIVPDDDQAQRIRVEFQRIELSREPAAEHVWFRPERPRTDICVWGRPASFHRVNLLVEFAIIDMSTSLATPRITAETTISARFPLMPPKSPSFRFSGCELERKEKIKWDKAFRGGEDYLLFRYGRDRGKILWGGALIRPGDFDDSSPS